MEQNKFKESAQPQELAQSATSELHQLAESVTKMAPVAKSEPKASTLSQSKQNLSTSTATAPRVTEPAPQVSVADNSSAVDTAQLQKQLDQLNNENAKMRE